MTAAEWLVTFTTQAGRSVVLVVVMARHGGGAMVAARAQLAELVCEPDRWLVDNAELLSEACAASA